MNQDKLKQKTGEDIFEIEKSFGIKKIWSMIDDWWWGGKNKRLT